MHGAFGSVDATAPFNDNGPESVPRPKKVYAVGSVSDETFVGSGVLDVLDAGDGAALTELAAAVGGADTDPEGGGAEPGAEAAGSDRMSSGLLELTAGPAGRDVALLPASAVAAIAIPATHNAAVAAAATPRR
jgi:hypothetical protein